MRAVTSAAATSATAVDVTVRTYERSDALCKAGPMRPLNASSAANVPEYRRSACSAAGQASRHRWRRYMNRATEPATVAALSANVTVKPCQRARVTMDSARVTEAVAKATGVE